MALLFADGFEDGLAGWLVINNTAVISTGRFGNGLSIPGGVGSIATGIVPATAGPIIVGFAYKPTDSPGGFLSFTHPTGGGFSHFALARQVGGEITMTHGNGTPIAGSSAANVLPLGAWSYVELKLVIHATTGSAIVRVNGVEVINATNVNTAGGGTLLASDVRLGYAPGVGASDGLYDDFYLCNTVGTVNVDFLGELMIEHLRPAADDTAQWLGSDGNSVNNYDLVDEAGAFGATDFVASSTVGQRDLYVPATSSRPITSPVFGVVVAAVAQKTDAGVRTAKLCVKEGSGGTVRQSAELGLPTTFGELRAVFERKGDGSQFTMADVNALRMGVELVT